MTRMTIHYQAQRSKKTEFSKKKQKTEFSQDEAAVFKDGRYSITGIEKSQSTEYDSPEAGKEFIIISLKYREQFG